MSEEDLEPVAVVVHRVLDLLELGPIRKVGGQFSHWDRVYRWTAYRIENKVGPPTIRVDLKEEI